MAQKTALVLNYGHHSNFGDRLGWQVAHSLFPADVDVIQHSLPMLPGPWTPPDVEPDLILAGSGNSLWPGMLDPAFLDWFEQQPCLKVALLGVQYEHLLPAEQTGQFLSSLDMWFVRYRQDAEVVSAPRWRHVGDLLINHFPMTQWTDDRRLLIPANINAEKMPVDEAIRAFQQFRTVHAHRIHPLLCALCAAERFSFTEQREADGNRVSGKFSRMLHDIFGDTFGDTFEENVEYENDRARVAAYKDEVFQHTLDIRRWIGEQL